MELELKQIAVYLPYNVEFIVTSDLSEDFAYDEWDGKVEDYKEGAIWELTSINTRKNSNISVGEGDLCAFIFYKGDTWISISDGLKPILRPLSDMYKEGIIVVYENILDAPYYVIQDLIKGHFDVFGLIEKGLAIDINTLNTK